MSEFNFKCRKQKKKRVELVMEEVSRIFPAL